MAGTFATLLRNVGRVASTAVAVTAQQNAAAQVLGHSIWLQTW